MATRKRLLKEKALYNVEKNIVMPTQSGGYLIDDFLGQGVFGKVAKCTKLDTQEVVAVKIVRKDRYKMGKREHKILKKLRQLDPDKNNLIRFNEHFKYRGHICLAFEKLDKSIFDLMCERDFMPLHVSEIRVIAQQMLVALNALKSIKVVHGDIKPDNIMLINHQLQPFNVKLIDFGLAMKTSTLLRGTIIQALGYRAPEVILGLPLDESIDLWSLGCILVFLFIGQNLYPKHTAYGVIRAIVQLQGPPDKHLLSEALDVEDFFTLTQNSLGRVWRLNTSTEYAKATGTKVQHYRGICDTIKTLDELPNLHSGLDNPTEDKDTRAFISLLKRMLHINPRKRITPSEALGHHFITMKQVHSKGPYASIAHTNMRESQLEKASVERYATFTESLDIASSTNLKQPLKGKRKAGSVSNKYATTSRNLNTTTTRQRKEPKKEAGLGKAKADGHCKKSPATKDTNKISPSKTEDTTYFVEVKSSRKYIKRINKFFSRVFEYITCGVRQ